MVTFGDGWRTAGEAMTDWTNPSDQFSVHGPMPVRVMSIVPCWPASMTEPPVTVAVGGLMVTLSEPFAVVPHEAVTVTFSVTCPEQPAV